MSKTFRRSFTLRSWPGRLFARSRVSPQVLHRHDCVLRVAAAAKALFAAKQPVVIVGNGVRNAQAYDALAALAEAASPPVVTTAAFPETHTLALGVFGTFGTEAANAAVTAADLVLAIGTKLGPSDTAWENRGLLDPTRQTFIQIDVEPKNASWNFPAEHVLVGDAGVLRQLIDDVSSQSSGRRAAGEARVAALRRKHIVVVFNNNALGWVYHGSGPFAAEFKDFDHSAIARAARPVPALRRVLSWLPFGRGGCELEAVRADDPPDGGGRRLDTCHTLP